MLPTLNKSIIIIMIIIIIKLRGLGNLRPRLHGAGQVFIRTSFCTDKLRLHGTGKIFVRFAFPFTRCLI